MPIPDDGWLTIRDRDHDALLATDSTSQVDGVEVARRTLALAGRLYECPECGRLMWSLPGDGCTNFRIYHPEK
jgi:hypothetical protein